MGLTTHSKDNFSLTIQLKDDNCLTALFNSAGLCPSRRFLLYNYTVPPVDRTLGIKKTEVRLSHAKYLRRQTKDKTERELAIRPKIEK